MILAKRGCEQVPGVSRLRAGRKGDEDEVKRAIRYKRNGESLSRLKILLENLIGENRQAFIT